MNRGIQLLCALTLWGLAGCGSNEGSSRTAELSSSQQEVRSCGVTDLGTLAGDTSSIALGLNSRGQVVGASYSTPSLFHPFVWSASGGMDPLPLPPGGFTFGQANGINDKGQIVGTAFGPVDDRAVLWSGGTVLNLGTLSGGESQGQAINSKGEIAGVSAGSSGARAFFWKAGTMTDLGTLTGSTHAEGFAINDKGQVAGMSVLGGFRPAVWTGTSIVNLGVPAGVADAIAVGINKQGVVAVYSTSQQTSFVFDGGAFTNLGTLGGATAQARGINKRGEVVGASSVAGGGLHAFRWKDGVLTDLNLLVPAGSGWVLTNAQAINDLGQIAGQGTIGGQEHAFLLTPCP